MRIIQNTIAVVFSFLFITGYITNVASQIYFGDIYDYYSILLPLTLLGVWLYVKIEELIKKRQE